MNLTISGHHLEVTPALREYVVNKLDRVTRHFDQVVDIAVTLKFNPHRDETHRHTVSMNLYVKKRDFRVEYTNGDMYATIDQVVDCLDRQVVEHKGQMQHHRCVSGKRVATA